MTQYPESSALDLYSLIVEDGEISQSGFDLRCIQTLELLFFKNVNIRSLSLARLVSCQNLHTLKMESCNLDNDIMPPITFLLSRKLRHLSLRNNPKINSHGIQGLAKPLKSSRLQVLQLDGAINCPSGATRVCINLPSSLRELAISEFNFNPKALDALIKANLECIRLHDCPYNEAYEIRPDLLIGTNLKIFSLKYLPESSYWLRDLLHKVALSKSLEEFSIANSLSWNEALRFCKSLKFNVTLRKVDLTIRQPHMKFANAFGQPDSPKSFWRIMSRLLQFSDNPLNEYRALCPDLRRLICEFLFKQ